LLALVNTATVADAAKSVGMSERSAYRHMADPAFAARWQEMRSHRLAAALKELQDGAGEAVLCLRRNLTCGSPAAEIRAAAAILDFGMRATELLDLTARVEALEEMGELRYGKRGA
jgi:hypothetical protein